MYKTLQFCIVNVSRSAAAKKHRHTFPYRAQNKKVLMELFGFNHVEADTLLEVKQLVFKEPAELKETFQFLQKFGYSNSDLLKYPGLLLSPPIRHVQHYYFLEDAGFRPITPEILSKASSIINRFKIKRVKKDGYLNKLENVSENFLSVLRVQIKKPETLNAELRLLDEMRLSEVHRVILVDWLKVRLDATDDDLVKLFRIHKMIKNKSFRIIEENISLAESLGLTKEKILKCGYLLNNYPDYPKTMLREHPMFVGIDLRHIYKHNPKMMMINPRKFHEIYQVLKSFNISDECIRAQPHVFLLSPITVQKRLSVIQKTPEFKVMTNHRRMLTLLVHQTKIQKRLSFVRSMNIRCASIGNIGNLSENSFEDFIQQGQDVNTAQSVITFFSELLDVEKDYVRKQLPRHPHYCFVPFPEIDASYKSLVRRGYKRPNIARCMVLLLYSRRQIGDAIFALEKEPELNFRDLSQTKQLHLVLYQIEKDYHFTGNGIWRTDHQRMNQLEEKTLE